jgi:hypothetical protein
MQNEDLVKPNAKIYSRGFKQNFIFNFPNRFQSEVDLEILKKLKQCRAGFWPKATAPPVAARDGGLAGPRHVARARHTQSWLPHSGHRHRRSC